VRLASSGAICARRLSRIWHRLLDNSERQLEAVLAFQRSGSVKRIRTSHPVSINKLELRFRGFRGSLLVATALLLAPRSSIREIRVIVFHPLRLVSARGGRLRELDSSTVRLEPLQLRRREGRVELTDSGNGEERGHGSFSYRRDLVVRLAAMLDS
jgi:hypothetical protein